MNKIATILIATAIAGVSAANAQEVPDTFLIPERAVIATGSAENGRPLVGILYNPINAHFSDPRAPRFLFLDRDGKVAFGIGGYVKGTMYYDFAGSINDGPNFTTFDIPVPNNPAQRSQYNATANHSTIFLQLVGTTEKFGNYEVFIQTNFSGDGNTGYGLKLKQAYLRLGYVTAGLTRSTFVDGAAGTPTIDDEGPSGEMSANNIMLQYRPQFNKHWSGAISIEVPNASATVNSTVEEIKERVPDIPFYIQYAWMSGKSHVRLSGIVRNLSYRNLIEGKNKYAFGWAVQLSGLINFAPRFTFFYQGAYGRGYGRYINDLGGNGYDIVPSATPGKMITPQMMNFEVGARYDVTSKLFLATSYSQARVYDQQQIGGDAYRYGQYVSVSGFYNIVSDLTVGIEYLYGNRANLDRVHGHANRINGMLQFSF